MIRNINITIRTNEVTHVRKTWVERASLKLREKRLFLDVGKYHKKFHSHVKPYIQPYLFLPLEIIGSTGAPQFPAVEEI